MLSGYQQWTSSSRVAVDKVALLQQSEARRRVEDTAIHLHRIGRLNFFSPLSVLVARDGDGYLAKAPDLPEVYGCGDTAQEAVEMLQEEIVSLYDDLRGDDEFTPDWDAVREFFKRYVER
jgi:predicted RNase H-like HicB family nuclease